MEILQPQRCSKILAIIKTNMAVLRASYVFLKISEKKILMQRSKFSICSKMKHLEII